MRFIQHTSHVTPLYLHGCKWILYRYTDVSPKPSATVNQLHPPVHHPLDAGYYSVVDEPQLSLHLVSPW